MLTDRIQPTLTAEKEITINTAFTTIEAELDFLVSLEPAQAKRLAKLGLRNETFSRAVMEAAAQNPGVVPASMNAAGLAQNNEVREKLLALQERARRLHEKLHHTNVVLGVDMYAGARAIYKAFQTFGRAAGLNGLVDALAQRFKRRAKAAATPVVPAP